MIGETHCVALARDPSAFLEGLRTCYADEAGYDLWLMRDTDAEAALPPHHKSASELVADLTGHIGHPATGPTPAPDACRVQLVLNCLHEEALNQPNIVICLRALYAIGCFRVALKYP